MYAGLTVYTKWDKNIGLTNLFPNEKVILKMKTQTRFLSVNECLREYGVFAFIPSSIIE